MEFAVPISRFDPQQVKWGELRSGPFRKTAPFGYEDGQLSLSNLVLVLQPLRVVEIDTVRNQLVLEETRRLSFLSKIEQLQQLVIQNLEKHSKHWLGGTGVNQSSLQPWLKSRRLTLYLSAQPHTLPFFEGAGAAVFSTETVKPGDLIRAVVKIQGVSLQMSEDNIWTGRSRIQHHVLQLYKLTDDPTAF